MADNTPPRLAKGKNKKKKALKTSLWILGNLPTVETSRMSWTKPKPTPKSKRGRSRVRRRVRPRSLKMRLSMVSPSQLRQSIRPSHRHSQLQGNKRPLLLRKRRGMTGVGPTDIQGTTKKMTGGLTEGMTGNLIAEMTKKMTGGIGTEIGLTETAEIGIETRIGTGLVIVTVTGIGSETGAGIGNLGAQEHPPHPRPGTEIATDDE